MNIPPPKCGLGYEQNISGDEKTWKNFSLYLLLSKILPLYLEGKSKSRDFSAIIHLMNNVITINLYLGFDNPAQLYIIQSFPILPAKWTLNALSFLSLWSQILKSKWWDIIFFLYFVTLLNYYLCFPLNMIIYTQRYTLRLAP